jgi:hypothetical protein
MRRWFVLLASIPLTMAIFQGCGGSDTEPLKVAPGTDTRTEQDKAAEAALEKSIPGRNKARR